MQRTYNQILATLGAFAVGHPQVNSHSNGFKTDINQFLKDNEDLSFLFFEPLSISLNTNTQDYRVRIYSLDFKQKDNAENIGVNNPGNSQDVLSDTSQILTDLRKYLISSFEDNKIFSIQFDSTTLIPVNNYTADYCVGWYMDITISSALIESDCDIPAVTTLCPQVTLFINETFIGESFETFLINVINQDGDQVGELINGNWVVTTGEDCLPITLINSDNCQVGQITQCPPDGNYTIDNTRFFVNGVSILSTPYNQGFNLVLEDLTIDSVTPACGSNTIVNLSVPACEKPFPINIINSDDCQLDTINEEDLNPDGSFTIADIALEGPNGSFGPVPSPSTIAILGADITSAIVSANGCKLDITVEGGVTNIIPNRVIPNFSSVIDFTGDLGWQWNNGTYDYNDGSGIKQELDPTAGVEYFFRLKYNNQFGNQFRFTDDQGVPAPLGRFDFPSNTSTPNSIGATPGYFIDHLTGLGWTHQPVASVKEWDVSLNLCNTLVIGSYNDFRMPSCNEVLSLTFNTSLVGTGVVADVPFERGGSVAGNSFDPTPGGVISICWVNRIIDLRGREVNDFRLRVSDAPITTATSRGTYAVRTHF